MAYSLAVTLFPWDYLWVSFKKVNFPDLFDPVWMSALVLLVALVALYAWRTRQLHRHRLYLDMWEWLLWTGGITFTLVVIGAIFGFDFAVEMTILLVGVAVLVWVRFMRYPALFDAYEHQLARQRYLARAKATKPEATIRSKAVRRRRRH